MTVEAPKRLTLIGFLIQVVLAAGLVFLGLKLFSTLAAMKEPIPKKPPIVSEPAVFVTPVNYGPYQETLSILGFVRPMSELEIRSELMGKVTTVLEKARPGVVIPAGTVLAELDGHDERSLAHSVTLQIQQLKERRDLSRKSLKTLELQTIQAKKERDSASAELRRIEGLQGRSSSTPTERDQQVAAVARAERVLLELARSADSLRSELAQNALSIAESEAQLKRATKNVERLVIKSPQWPVRITERLVEPGMAIGQRQVLFRSEHATRQEIHLTVDASWYDEVQEGTEVSVWPAHSEERLARTLKVSRKASGIEERDRTFTIWLEQEVTEDTPRWPKGLFVNATLKGRKHERVMAIPNIALLGNRVFVTRPERAGAKRGVVAAHEVSLSRRLANVALIEGGLEEGDLIITSNLEALIAGESVRWGDTSPPVAEPR